jgi:hypothetical protein
MKIRTDIHAGDCPKQWYTGKVEEASGGGYYGAIRGQDGQIHYFNMGYTQFLPNGQGVNVGQNVPYAPFIPPNPRAGKAAYIKSS